MKVLTSAATYEQHPERAWERFKTRARKPRDLAVLMDLAAWRESEAQTRDVPRARVLKDDVLIEVALAAPRTQEALGNLRAFPRGMERSRAGEEILAAVERGLGARPQDACPSSSASGATAPARRRPSNSSRCCCAR